jgi:hypothetical protein
LSLREKRSPPAEALIRTAPGLRQAERLDLLTGVLALGRFAAGASVRRELAGLVAVGRRANDVGSQTR